MSDAEQPEDVITTTTRKTLTDVRWLLGLGVGGLVAVFAAGASGLAQAQSAGREAAKAETAGIATEQAALKATVSDLRAEVADVKEEVRELRKDLRVLFPRLPAPDGGQ